MSLSNDSMSMMFIVLPVSMTNVVSCPLILSTVVGSHFECFGS